MKNDAAGFLFHVTRLVCDKFSSVFVRLNYLSIYKNARFTFSAKLWAQNILHIQRSVFSTGKIFHSTCEDSRSRRYYEYAIFRISTSFDPLFQNASDRTKHSDPILKHHIKRKKPDTTKNRNPKHNINKARNGNVHIRNIQIAQ